MIEVVLRTSIVLVAAWVGSRLLSRATAATRHLVWQAAIVAVLAAPLLTWIVPKYEVPFGNPPSLGLMLEPSFGVAGAHAYNRLAPATPPASPKIASEPKASEGGTLAAVTRAGEGGLPSMQIVWLLGSCLVGLWFLATHVMAAILRRRARAASPELQREVDALAAHAGVSTRVVLLMSDSDAGPFTVGVFRARIVLPSHAESWDRARLRSVLLHELAHVRRGDCRTQALASAASAVYWFNPLVWMAARALRRERERACDDEVLMGGVQASAYATHLLDIARGLQTRRASPAQIAMARSRELEGRLLAILAAGQGRLPAPATRWVVAAVVGATTIATLGAQPSPPSQGVGASLSAGASAKAEAPPMRPAHGQDREKTVIALALDTSPDVIPALIGALQDPNSQVREKAALGLGWRKDARVVEPLIAALRDSDSQVREKAAIALGASGDVRARAPLEAALNDPVDRVREKAVTGLTLLGSGRDPEADGALVRAALGGLARALLQFAQ